MLMVGNFSARLVEATTKQPLPEHSGSRNFYYSMRTDSTNDNGDEVFVEVEPGTEYYVAIQVVGDDIPPKKKFCFEFVVDGIKLESRTITNKKAGPGMVGLLSSKHGVLFNQAFRFKNASNRRSHRHSYTLGPDMVFGSVVVIVSEAVKLPHQRLQEGFKEAFGAVPHILSTCHVNNGQKGIIRSTEGTVSASSPSTTSTRVPCYHPGELVQEINLKYGTKLDLIYAGVLNPPPLWEHHRLKYGIDNSKHLMKALSLPHLPPHKRIKVDAIYDGATMLSPPREVELFDLTRDENAVCRSNRTRKESGSSEDSPNSVPALIYSP